MVIGIQANHAVFCILWSTSQSEAASQSSALPGQPPPWQERMGGSCSVYTGWRALSPDPQGCVRTNVAVQLLPDLGVFHKSCQKLSLYLKNNFIYNLHFFLLLAVFLAIWKLLSKVTGAWNHQPFSSLKFHSLPWNVSFVLWLLFPGNSVFTKLPRNQC